MFFTVQLEAISLFGHCWLQSQNTEMQRCQGAMCVLIPLGLWLPSEGLEGGQCGCSQIQQVLLLHLQGQRSSPYLHPHTFGAQSTKRQECLHDRECKMPQKGPILCIARNLAWREGLALLPLMSYLVFI